MKATLSPGGPRYSLATNNPNTIANPVCAVPNDINAVDFGIDNVQLTWTNIPNSGYTVYYRVKNTNWKGIATSTNAVTINNLLPATTYEFKLTVRCPLQYDLYSNQLLEISTKPLVVIKTCSDNYEPNNNFNTATIIPPFNHSKSMIAGASDVDFYRFDINNYTGNNYKLSLTGLTYDYDLIVYDKNYNFVSISQNFGKQNEVIINNNVGNNTYFVEVYPFGGVFDAGNCYDLYLETSNQILSRLTNTGTDNTIQKSNIEKKKNRFVNIYPNPTSSDIINIYTNYQEEMDIQVIISNMYGQVSLDQQYKVGLGSQNIKIDQKLSDGVYSISVITSKYSVETYSLIIAN
jgi:hypothetical protein